MFSFFPIHILQHAVRHYLYEVRGINRIIHGPDNSTSVVKSTLHASVNTSEKYFSQDYPQQLVDVMSPKKFLLGVWRFWLCDANGINRHEPAYWKYLVHVLHYYRAWSLISRKLFEVCTSVERQSRIWNNISGREFIWGNNARRNVIFDSASTIFRISFHLFPYSRFIQAK